MSPAIPAGAFKVRFTTAGRVAEVESWLGSNIKGAWSLRTDGMSDDMQQKNYVLTFVNEEDRRRFRTKYRAKPAA